jgi:hypothetical protein
MTNKRLQEGTVLQEGDINKNTFGFKVFRRFFKVKPKTLEQVLKTLGFCHPCNIIIRRGPE